MIVAVQPVKRLDGNIVLPASKSYSIRAFFVAACGGQSQIIQPSTCADSLVALRVARSLGAKVVRRNKTWVIYAAQLKKIQTINVGESGTALRFLLPLLALQGNVVTVIGEGTLVGRPNQHLVKLLRSQGVQVKGQGKKESVPIRFSGGKLRGGRLKINGSLSSQFISALLIACPQLKEDTRLVILGQRMVSADYIVMTEQILRRTGIKIQRKTARNFFIKGGQKFSGLRNFIVPSDYGLAAFLLAAAALVPSRLQLRGHLPTDLLQADARILGFLKQMGVRFTKTVAGMKICGPVDLKGGSFSLEASPDLLPIMAVLALFSRGKTRLRNIGHARVKESDRISDLRAELLKIGARIEERRDEIIIHPQPIYRADVLLDPHHDHRLAMAFAVLGLKVPVRIKDSECVAKSYPDFWKDFRKAGAKFSCHKS